jgi:hypothetical protein
MGFGYEEARARQQVFADRAEQAELRAKESADQSVQESWISIARSWRLLAENAGKNSKL